MIKAFSVPLQEDLGPFAEFLWKYEIPHRILEVDQEQQLWVARTVSPEQIHELYLRWQGGLDLNTVRVEHRGPDAATRADRWYHAWLTLALIVTSVMVTLITGLGDKLEWLRLFTIADLIEKQNHLYTSGLAATLNNLELWRLFTPMFLHFSMPHILFNLLWVWVVGVRIERAQGRWALLGLVLFAALSSNIAQYFVSGPLFGGMSGVVFALLAYAWLWDRRQPHCPVGLPPALMGFMLFWLALGFAGVLEGLGFGAIANTAHLVGLLAGLAFVPIGGWLARGR